MNNYQAPWTRGSFGWLIALLVLLVWILVLIKAIVGSETIVEFSFIGLALAILL